MALTWSEFNKNKGSTVQAGSAWNDFNLKMSKRAFESEAYSQNTVDKKLFQTLKERGVQTSDINQGLQPEKVSKLKTLGESALGILNTGLRYIKGTSQVLATPYAMGLAAVTPGVTMQQVKDESFRMAKELFTNPNANISQGTEDAAQMWLKSRGVGKYGGNKPTARDVLALVNIGFFDLLGDPVLSGVGLKSAKTLKEFLAVKPLAETDVAKKGVEMAVDDLLKVKTEPSANEIVIKGYKQKFPEQAAMPEGQLTKDTEELILGAKESTGLDMQANFQGDDLVLSPVVKKEATPLAQEATKYKSAEEFVKAQDQYVYHNSTQRNIETIKEEGISNKYAGEYPHGIKEISDSKPRIYLAEDPKRALTFGGSVDSKYPELKSALMRIKKSALGNDIYKPNLDGGEVWYFGDKISPENIEIFKDGEWQPLINKKSTLPTKSQLTDIWNKANKGVGEVKPSGLATTLEKDAMANEIKADFGDLPQYTTRPMKIDESLDYVSNNFEQAKKVVNGEINPPQDLLVGEVYSAMKKIAIKNGDIDTLMFLKNAKANDIATSFGREIQAFDAKLKGDPVQAMREVEQTRKTAAKSKNKIKLSAEEKKIQHEIKMVKKSEKDLEDFINSIKC